MSDLIDRAAAIDAIKAASKEIQHWLWEAEGCEGYCAMVADVETCLDDLPSAQPETHDKRTETHACDLISRQAAIDEAEEWIDAVYCDHDEQRERDAIRHVINGIKELPSAQPETHDKRTETHACDLISRQAAIDESKAVYEWHDYITMERLIEHIRKLPSAQPDVPDICVGDMISRKLMCDLGATCIARRDDDGKLIALGRIEELPSAQSDLESKILAAGYTGKEVRIYIGGRLFGVRELAQ